MNTVNDWKVTATVFDEERAKIWIEVFGKNVVPVTSMFTQSVNVPGHSQADAYMLDLKAITPEQREKLVNVLVKKLSVTRDYVEKYIDKGVPVLSNNTSVSCADPGIMFSLLPDEGFEDDNDDWDDPLRRRR